VLGIVLHREVPDRTEKKRIDIDNVTKTSEGARCRAASCWPCVAMTADAALLMAGWTLAILV